MKTRSKGEMLVAVDAARGQLANAELGALTGAVDRVWQRLSHSTRSELQAYIDAYRPGIRDLANHRLLCERVVQEIKDHARRRVILES